MKLLIKKLANTNFGITLRNALKIRPVYLKTFGSSNNLSVSDAFLWRTDNGYKTKFKYTDILDLFYKIKNSRVELHFYSKNNELLKIDKINNLQLSNELEITDKYLNNIQDYGVFYIYHFVDYKLPIDNKNIISNRCYLGYSQNENIYSFVHGNTLAKFTNIDSKAKTFTDIVKTSIFTNHYYTIQKYFENFDNNELFFSNPTSKIIKIYLNKEIYKLKPGCSQIVNTKMKIITFKSNCLFLRPTVFSYKNGFVDVHHS